MTLLPSGLPDIVGDAESLARFLTQSSHFTTVAVKPAALMPAPDGRKSVVRHDGKPPESLWDLSRTYLGADARVYGAAICVAADVRRAGLDVIAAEPPPRHANIVGWPVATDPAEQKARQKELALVIASQCVIVLRSP